ncbi:MAG TPA: DUF6481 family protein [Caulobacteraceae bacterium]|nr:DUF6481 family protein [Caulobacteraceae bacterium]
MQAKLKTGFVDRLSQSAAAKQALIQKMRRIEARTDPDFERREELRAAEVEAIRQKRAEEKAAARAAAAQAAFEAEQARMAAEDAVLQEKRAQRKERKALSAAEAKAKRDAKYAARKARQ